VWLMLAFDSRRSLTFSPRFIASARSTGASWRTVFGYPRGSKRFNVSMPVFHSPSFGTANEMSGAEALTFLLRNRQAER
jgi:hypothetical protein